MLRFAIVFAILALIAGVLGFGGMAGEFAFFAKILLFVFLVLFVVSLIFGQRAGPVFSERQQPACSLIGYILERSSGSKALPRSG